HPHVAEAAVIGVHNDLRGQVPLAFVVGGASTDDADARAVLEAELIRAVGRQLGALARPRSIVFVDALPRTRSGKVLRRMMQGAVNEVQAPLLAAEINRLAA